MYDKVIGLLTDFGIKDYYVSAMKAVILRICPEAKIIDISHEIDKYNVLQGAFLLKQAAKHFPDKSVIVGVVDPGVGGERKMIAIEGKRHFFVGPDNGLLTLAAFDEGIKRTVEIKNQKYFLQRSGTFDGRDVFAPIAAHILNGVTLDEIGPEVKDITNLSIPKPVFKGNKVKLTILHIDSFGNIVTNVEIRKFLDWCRDAKGFKLALDDEVITLGFAKSYENAQTELFFIPGSSEFMEISMKMSSAADRLKVKLGETLEVSKLVD